MSTESNVANSFGFALLRADLSRAISSFLFLSFVEQTMKRIAVLLAIVLSPLTLVAEESEWVSMFNGKSLAGWTQKSGYASYSVVDGAIKGVTAEGSPNSFLCSVTEYGDFEFEFEVKVHDKLNSGVQIRSQTRDEKGKHSIYNTGRVNGPQVEIEAGGEKGAEAGYVYGEAAGGWMTPKERLVPHKHFGREAVPSSRMWHDFFNACAFANALPLLVNAVPTRKAEDTLFQLSSPTACMSWAFRRQSLKLCCEFRRYGDPLGRRTFCFRHEDAQVFKVDVFGF